MFSFRNRCYCGRAFQTPRALKLHIAKSPCRKHWQEELDQLSSDEETSQVDIGDAEPATNEPLTYQNSCDDDFVMDDPPIYNPQPSGFPLPDHQSKSLPVHMEEVEDEDSCNRYPFGYSAGAAEALGTGESIFQALLKEKNASGQLPWAPFANQDEWELAEFLMKRMNKQSIEEFFDLPIVCLIPSLHLLCFNHEIL